MNKNEFLRQLEKELSILDKNERKELLDFYEERFYNGIYYEGKTEYQVIEELEPPKVIARNILEQYGVDTKKVTKPEERFEGIELKSIIWLVVVDAFFLSWIIPALFGVTMAIFGSVLTYIPMFAFIIGEKSQYDIMIFWFLTGFYVLLFNFALVILDLFLWTLKKAVTFHLNTFKIKRRAEWNKKLNKINVDGFIKKRKGLLSFKRLSFLGALLLVGIFGFRLAMNADNIYALYVNQEVLTETESLDLTLDITDETPWTIDVDVANMNVVLVESDTSELIVTREYQEEDYDFVLEIDEATKTVLVQQVYEHGSWDFNIDINLEEILKLIKPDVITIQVPNGLHLSSVNLNTMNGTMTVDSVDMGILVIETVNGKMSLQYFTAANIDILSVNANVVVEEVHVDSGFDVEVINGNIIVYDSSFKNSVLQTENGRVVLEDINVLDKDGVDLEISTTNGRVSLINVYIAKVDVSTVNGDIYYNNEETFTVDYDKETVNGDTSGNMD